MAKKSPKSIRFSEDAQRLLKLLAAYEDKTEGDIVEEAIATYLQVRSLAYSNTLDAARELAHSTPENAGEIVDRLTQAIAEALGEGRRAEKPGEAKRRLRARAAAATQAA